VLTRTIPLTLTPTQRARLQGACMPGPAPLLDQRPTRVQRTVSCRGGTQIIGQRVQVGLRYAGQIVTIEAITPHPMSTARAPRPSPISFRSR
jgi:hypothetical protein